MVLQLLENGLFERYLLLIGILFFELTASSHRFNIGFHCLADQRLARNDPRC